MCLACFWGVTGVCMYRAGVERDAHVPLLTLVICQGRHLRGLLTLAGAAGRASRSRTGSPGQGGRSGKTAS